MSSHIISELKEEVEKELQAALDNEPTDLAEPLREYINRGGKRIRPVMLVLSARAFNTSRLDNFKKAAIAIELFHNFTLIHDDIEDDSKYRRGKPTMHMIYGVPLAINFGDALYTFVWRKIINSGLSQKELNSVLETFVEVLIGQHMELTAIHEERFDLSYEEYFTLAGNKTGSLIALCASLPLLEVSEDKFKRLYAAVRQLGIAFQIKDDLLNLTGDFEKYKKKIGDDITEGKRTLLVLYALKNLPEAKAKKLRAILLSHTEDEAQIKEAVDLIKESGAVGFAEETAEKIIKENLPVVEELLPDSEEKTALITIIKMFIIRES